MDKFEKEYFEILQEMSRIFGNKRQALAESRIKMFSAALARQILTEKQNFDLIIGAGNSGLFMTKIASLIYEILGQKMPPIVNIPVKRIITDKKEAVIVGGFSLGLLQINNILFVDDEIMRGLTVKACLESILKRYPKINHLQATILAENHFFEWHYILPKVSVRFFAYSRLIQGLNGNIGYFIPEKLFLDIKKILPEVASYNQAMAIMISGQIKRIKNGLPFFDNKIENTLKINIPGYIARTEKLLYRLKGLVYEGVKDYQRGKIVFRF